ncbi:MAG TPA: four helix bundle protein [Thermoanaerobaculia bacterium]|nr:four helix bundle protein [Thermoanaerobaculia bacterium]
MSDSYRDLIVWQKAMSLVVSIYRSTAEYPREERFGLTAQTRGSAVSIPSNIAEGHGRLGRREWEQFLGYARGSLLELETQVILGKRLQFLDDATASGLLARTAEIGSMLNGLLASIARRQPRKSFSLQRPKTRDETSRPTENQPIPKESRDD